MAKPKKTEPKKPESGNDSERGTVFVKAKKAYAKTRELKVVKEKEPPRRTEVKEPLTDEQRNELNKLITDYVTTANLAKKPLKNSFGTAWTNLYEYGLEGKVNGIEQIEQSEFEDCLTFIKQRIMALESGDDGGLTRLKDDWTKRRIKAIQSACSANKVSEEKRKAYMLHRWGVDSLLLMSDAQLEECRRYAVNNPTWNIPKVEILGTQQQREKALARWLDRKEEEAKARGEEFDRQDIRVKGGKTAAIAELAQTNESLFTDDDGQPIDMETFNKFLTKAKLCKFSSGRPRKPKT